MVVPTVQRFDPTKPAASIPGSPSRFHSQDMRSNFQALSRANDLRCTQQNPPDLTVFVEAGAYSISSDSTQHFPGGNSSALDTTTGGVSTQQRIFVLELDALGSLTWNTNGAWVTPPVLPVPPSYSDQRISLCEVLVTYGDIEIIQSNIIDVRPMINLGVGVGELVNPGQVTLTAAFAGQADFDTSSQFHFFQGQHEILVWTDKPSNAPCIGLPDACNSLLFRIVDVDYIELNDHTIRFLTAANGGVFPDFAIGDRVVIWKIGMSATPGKFSFNDLSDVSVANTNDSGDRGTALVPRERFSVSSLTRVGSTATAVTSLPHTFQNGDIVAILGAVQTEYNGTHTITFVNSTTFTYSVSGTPATPATGVILAVGDIPSAINPYQTVYSHNLINHLTDVPSLAPVAAHITSTPPLLSPVAHKHRASDIEINPTPLYASPSTDVQAALNLIDTNIYLPFRAQHFADGKHGPKVTIAQVAADNALSIEKSNIAGGNVVNIINSGTGYGLNINQNGEATALAITKFSTGSNPAILIDNSGTGTGAGVRVLQNGDAAGIRVEKSSTGSAPAVEVFSTGTGAAVAIVQNGVGPALTSDQSAVGQTAVRLTRNASGAGYSVQIDQSHTGSTQSALIINNNGSLYGLHVQNLNSADAASVIRIDNASAGYDIQGNGNSWRIDKLGNIATNTDVDVGDNLTVNENTYLGPSGGFLRIGQGPDLTVVPASGGYVILTHTLHRVDCNGTGLRFIYTGSFGNTPAIGTVIMLAGPSNTNALLPRTDAPGSNQSLNGNYAYTTVLTYVWMGDKWYTVTSA